MSKSLIEQMRAARRTRVESCGKTFIVRRPTDMEMMELRGEKLKQGDIIRGFVEGWEGFAELDLISSGGPEPVPFSADVFGEYIADHPEHWDAIVMAVITSYEAHKAATDDAVKN